MPKITILKQYVTFSNAYNFVEYSYENAVRNAEFQEVTDQEFSDLIKIVNELNKKLMVLDISLLNVQTKKK